ncbi:hypothetical protein [Erwinia sp. MYb535]
MLTTTAVESACRALEQDFQPLSDFRASEWRRPASFSGQCGGRG